MAVRNTKAAQELIQQWQNEWSGKGLPLNIEVTLLFVLILVICLLQFLWLIMCISGTETSDECVLTYVKRFVQKKL